MTTYGDLFTPRQLVALTTFSDLVTEARARVERDAIVAGLPDDSTPLRDGGTGAKAYCRGSGGVFGVCVWIEGGRPEFDGMSDGTSLRQNTHATLWATGDSNDSGTSPKATFFGTLRVGSVDAAIAWDSRIRSYHSTLAIASKSRRDALRAKRSQPEKVVSTDPPYYDNIGYADLSDFFYVWLRRSLKPVFPDLFATLAVPKAEELVATPYRHGNKKKAETFFLAGMGQAMQRLAEQAHPGFPVTIYYAFKQSEKKGDEGTSSTGWETFLDAVIRPASPSPARGRCVPKAQQSND